MKVITRRLVTTAAIATLALGAASGAAVAADNGGAREKERVTAPDREKERVAVPTREKERIATSVREKERIAAPNREKEREKE